MYVHFLIFFPLDLLCYIHNFKRCTINSPTVYAFLLLVGFLVQLPFHFRLFAGGRFGVWYKIHRVYVHHIIWIESEAVCVPCRRSRVLHCLHSHWQLLHHVAPNLHKVKLFSWLDTSTFINQRLLSVISPEVTGSLWKWIVSGRFFALSRWMRERSIPLTQHLHKLVCLSCTWKW